MTNDTQTEQWWITTGSWLPDGKVHTRHGVALGPFGSRGLALEMRALIEKAERRDDLFVGRMDEARLPA